MSKHMTLEERQQIQMALNNGENFSQIAQLIGKNRSTVTREVRSHRIVWEHHAYGRSGNRCINRFSCALKHLCDPDCRKNVLYAGNAKPSAATILRNIVRNFRFRLMFVTAALIYISVLSRNSDMTLLMLKRNIVQT